MESRKRDKVRQINRRKGRKRKIYEYMMRAFDNSNGTRSHAKK